MPRSHPCDMSRFLALMVTVTCSLFASALGTPTEGESTNPAPSTEVVAVIFSDFHNPSCAEVSPLLEELAKARHLNLQQIFKQAPNDPAAIPAHEAAMAAGAQGRYRAMQDLLFRKPDATQADIDAMAQTLHLDIQRFRHALEQREFHDAVLQDIAEARGLGVRSTPTLFVNGSRVDGIDALRSAVRGVVTSAPPAWESLPVEALTLDFSGSPSSGPDKAPITIVEFTDFRCGFCRINSRVLSELTAAYPGKVRRIFKHYPHDSGASLAANQQGKFWEMHQSIMTRPLDNRADLLDRARSMGLQMETFEKDLDDPRFNALLARDSSEGEHLGIHATPTTFLNGRRVVGRQSLETWKKHVDELLGTTSSVVTHPSTPSEGVTSARISSSLAIGPEDAAFLVEAFVDAGAPGASNLVATLKQFSDERPAIRIQFKNLPDPQLPGHLLLHESLMAAAAQNRFWPMLTAVVSSEGSWNIDGLNRLARGLGMDTDRFTASLTNHQHLSTINLDVTEGQQRRLHGSAVFINGTRFEGEPTVGNWARQMEESSCCGKSVASKK
jgi:protein-disulfide isomerase